jgi:hypothetical protein
MVVRIVTEAEIIAIAAVNQGRAHLKKRIVMPGRCQGTARALPGRCQGAARALSGRCHGAADAANEQAGSSAMTFCRARGPRRITLK